MIPIFFLLYSHHMYQLETLLSAVNIKLFIKCPIIRPVLSDNRVPTQTGKPGKMGRHFPVREKSGIFNQTGKVRENHTKYRNIQEFQTNIIRYFFSDI